MRNLIIIFIICLEISGCATTAAVLLFWDASESVELKSLEPGTEVEVILRNRQTVEGSFKKADDKYLYLDIQNEEKLIALYDIKSVEIPDLTLRWFSIGFGYAVDYVLFYHLVITPLKELR